MCVLGFFKYVLLRTVFVVDTNQIGVGTYFDVTYLVGDIFDACKIN